MDRDLDRDYSLAEVCAATGRKPAAVKMMVHRTVLQTVDSKPGTGHRRKWRLAEIWKLALIVELERGGFTQKEAAEALSNITTKNPHWWRRDPELPLVLLVARARNGKVYGARKCTTAAQLQAL